MQDPLPYGATETLLSRQKRQFSVFRKLGVYFILLYKTADSMRLENYRMILNILENLS